LCFPFLSPSLLDIFISVTNRKGKMTRFENLYTYRVPKNPYTVYTGYLVLTRNSNTSTNSSFSNPCFSNSIWPFFPPSTNLFFSTPLSLSRSLFLALSLSLSSLSPLSLSLSFLRPYFPLSLYLCLSSAVKY
jgi:hypothetical protein